MASIVVYKVVKLPDNKLDYDRFLGMKEAGDLIASATRSSRDPRTIISETLSRLIKEEDDEGTPRYKVTYTHTDDKEYKLESNGSDRSGKYKYNISKTGSDYKRIMINPRIDKPDNNGVDIMHLTAPRDPVNLTNPSYLDKIISDVESKDEDDVRKYLFGTIILRRCR